MLLQASEQSRVVLSPKIVHLDMLLIANSIAHSLLSFVIDEVSNQKEDEVSKSLLANAIQVNSSYH